MSEPIRTFPARQMREPHFLALRALREVDRKEQIEAQLAGGVDRDAAEAHADDEEALVLD